MVSKLVKVSMSVLMILNEHMRDRHQNLKELRYCIYLHHGRCWKRGKGKRGEGEGGEKERKDGKRGREKE